MDYMKDRILTVLGIHFLKINDVYSIKTDENQMVYIFFADDERGEDDISSLKLFIRNFSCPYRICLFDVGGNNKIGYCIYFDENDIEEVSSLVEWISKAHKGWTIIKYDEENFHIIGKRIANNMFHEQLLLKQGELLD